MNTGGHGTAAHSTLGCGILLRVVIAVGGNDMWARRDAASDGTNLDLFCSADEFRTVLVVEERTMTLHGCHILMDMDVALHHMSTNAPTRWSLILDTFCTLD